MNPAEKFSKKTPEEQNRTYLTTIIVCICVAAVFCLGMLFLAFPEKQDTPENRGTNADSAISEISAGILLKSEDILSSALTYTEAYYTTTPSEKRSELAAKRFVRLFYEELRSQAGIKGNAKEHTVTSGKEEYYRVRVPDSELESGESEKEATFADYLKSLTLEKRGVSVSADRSGMYIACCESGQYVEIQNLKIDCKDGSSATVRIRFTAPKDVIGESVSHYAGAVNAYAAAADGDIISTGGRNRIEGSVYAGSSIQAQTGGELQLNGDQTVTRGDISASGSVFLNILKGEVWAQNLHTIGSGASDSYTTGINMEINADCFISGDLFLENPGYSVNIDGNYFGYGTLEKNPDGTTVNETVENKLDGTEMDSILQRLLAGSYTVLTDENGTTMIISDEARAAAEAEAAKIASQAAMEAGGSTIRINANGATALVAYSSGQILWLAATDYYGKAEPSGRSAITDVSVPNGLGSGKKDSGAANLDTLYTYQFNGLTAALDKNASTSTPSWNLVKHLLKISGLSGKNVIYTENNSGKYEPHTLTPTKGSSGDYIPIMPKSDYRSGVLIADCDVRIANTDFNGIILTTGNIILTGGAEIHCDPASSRFTGVTENLQTEAEKDLSNSRVTVSVKKVKK